MSYASTSDVQARFPAYTFSTTSKPTLAQITQWLTEAYAFLNGALAAAGLTYPNTDARGTEILKSWEADYAEGHVRRTFAAAGGDGSNDDGKDLLAAFRELIKDMRADPAYYGQLLESGSSPAEALRVRKPSNLDDDGNEIEPIWSRDESASDLGGEF